LKINIPTQLTLFRIICVPIFVGLFYLPYPYGSLSSAVVFAIASITDYVDGYMARILKQTSKFGAFLDPVADKLTVCVALVLLTSDHNLPYIALPALVIIGREIVISSLREWMAGQKAQDSVAVAFIGKVKTGSQMGSIVLLLACNPLSAGLMMAVGYFGIYFSACLTLWSMVLYLLAARKSLKA
jgi:CDP-diacylglycerol---glycerol-3-phosphate 3-phosphatidyltransferase